MEKHLYQINQIVTNARNGFKRKIILVYFDEDFKKYRYHYCTDRSDGTFNPKHSAFSCLEDHLRRWEQGKN
jgi:hypothetical protein